MNACYIANKVIISFSRDHQHFSLDEKNWQNWMKNALAWQLLTDEQICQHFKLKKERSIFSEAQRAEVGVGFLLYFKCSGRFLLLHSWHWASRDTELRRPISVCVSDYYSQTTGPICIKITIVDRTYQGDYSRLVTFDYLQPPHWNSSKRPNNER